MPFGFNTSAQNRRHELLTEDDEGGADLRKIVRAIRRFNRHQAVLFDDDTNVELIPARYTCRLGTPSTTTRHFPRRYRSLPTIACRQSYTHVGTYPPLKLDNNIDGAVARRTRERRADNVVRSH